MSSTAAPQRPEATSGNQQGSQQQRVSPLQDLLRLGGVISNLWPPLFALVTTVCMLVAVLRPEKLRLQMDPHKVMQYCMFAAGLAVPPQDILKPFTKKTGTLIMTMLCNIPIFVAGIILAGGFASRMFGIDPEAALSFAFLSATCMGSAPNVAVAAASRVNLPLITVSSILATLYCCVSYPNVLSFSTLMLGALQSNGEHAKKMVGFTKLFEFTGYSTVIDKQAPEAAAGAVVYGYPTLLYFQHFKTGVALPFLAGSCARGALQLLAAKASLPSLAAVEGFVGQVSVIVPAGLMGATAVSKIGEQYAQLSQYPSVVALVAAAQLGIVLLAYWAPRALLRMDEEAGRALAVQSLMRNCSLPLGLAIVFNPPTPQIGVACAAAAITQVLIGSWLGWYWHARPLPLAPPTKARGRPGKKQH